MEQRKSTSTWLFPTHNVFGLMQKKALALVGDKKWELKEILGKHQIFVEIKEQWLFDNHPIKTIGKFGQTFKASAELQVNFLYVQVFTFRVT